MKRREKNKDLRARCLEFIQQTKTLQEAQKLAKKHGFSANTSVWLSACSGSLKAGKPPWMA